MVEEREDIFSSSLKEGEHIGRARARGGSESGPIILGFRAMLGFRVRIRGKLQLRLQKMREQETIESLY